MIATETIGNGTETIENGTDSYSYTYDAVGRRVEKTINGTTTKYLYDGADIIMEMTSSGTPTVFYVRTLNIDEPLARIDLSSGEIRYYHADALGSIIALTDENGTVKTQYNYSPFGATEIIGEQSDNPFMFTGREWDGATGLYYFRNRYQSPILGRFISEDPIGLAGGINFYSYVGNSPLNFRDPLGLEGEDWAGAFGVDPNPAIPLSCVYNGGIKTPCIINHTYSGPMYPNIKKGKELAVVVGDFALGVAGAASKATVPVSLPEKVIDSIIEEVFGIKEAEGAECQKN